MVLFSTTALRSQIPEPTPKLLFFVSGGGTLGVPVESRYIPPGTPNTPTTTSLLDRYWRVPAAGEQYSFGAIYNIKETGNFVAFGFGLFYKGSAFEINRDTLAKYNYNNQPRPFFRRVTYDKNIELQLKYGYKHQNWTFGAGLRYFPTKIDGQRAYYLDGNMSKFSKFYYHFGDLEVNINVYAEIERIIPILKKHEMRVGLSVERRRTFKYSRYWDFGLNIKVPFVLIR